MRKISVSPALAALLCVLLYLDTDGLVLPFLLAAVLHELGHLLAMLCAGIRPQRFRIGLRGAVITAHFYSMLSELLVALAGPAVNFLLALCSFRCWPVFCMANALLLLYNLLPVYPLDGGRVCILLSCRFFGEARGWAVAAWVSYFAIALVVGLCIYACFVCNYGLFPCVFAAIFLLKLPNGPCQKADKLLE